jgi:amidase
VRLSQYPKLLAQLILNVDTKTTLRPRIFLITHALSYPLPPWRKLIDTCDTQYQPVSDFDKENFEMYDPELFDGMPVALQLIGRNLEEEKLLVIANRIDLDAIQAI